MKRFVWIPVAAAAAWWCDSAVAGVGGGLASDGVLAAGVGGVGQWLSDLLTTSLEGGAYYVAIPVAILGGMLLALTPCVLPMIPIVVRVLVGGEKTTAGRRVLASGVYTLGLALVYGILGLVAASSGRGLGQILQYPVVLIAFTAFFGVMALGMFGVFELQVPAFMRDKLQVQGKGDLASAFLMGAVSALIASPCIGPVLAGALVWAAKTQNPTLSFAMFFFMGTGLGLPFVIAAVVGGRLLKPGPWMVKIKKLLGVLLLFGTAYFADLVAGWTGLLVTAGICAVVAVVGVIYQAKSEQHTPAHERATGLWQGSAWGAACCLIFGVVFVDAAVPTAIAWQEADVAAVLDGAKADGKPVFVDFTAEWCIPCRQMDKTTFVDPAVIAEAQRFVAIKADITQGGEPDVAALVQNYQVLGPPTILFFDGNGEYLADAKVVGQIGAEDFLAKLKSVQ